MGQECGAAPRAAAGRAVPTALLRRSLHESVLGAFISGPFFSTVMGTSFPLLAKTVGMNDRVFGLVAAIPSAVMLLQLPGVVVLERLGHRRLVMALTAAGHRLLWIAIAAVPLVLGMGPGAIGVVAALVALSNLSATLCGLTWSGVMADMVPARRRGKFFGIRSRMSGVTMLAGSLAVGWVLDLATPATMGWYLLGVYAVVAVLALAECPVFLRIPEGLFRPASRAGALATLRGPLKDGQFRRFLLLAVMVTSSTAILGPFLWQHAYKELHVTPWQGQWMLQIAPLTAAILMAPWWGKCFDRFGRKATLALAMVGGTLVTLCWPVVRDDIWWLGVLVGFLGQFFWSGVDQAMLNSVMRFTAGKDGKGGGTSYPAIYAVTCATAATVAGFAAAELAQRLGTAEWIRHVEAAISPLRFNRYIVLLLLSVVMRVVAMAVVLPRLPREGTVPTTRSMAVMASQLYSSFSTMVEKPFEPILRRLPGRR